MCRIRADVKTESKHDARSADKVSEEGTKNAGTETREPAPPGMEPDQPPLDQGVHTCQSKKWSFLDVT